MTHLSTHTRHVDNQRAARLVIAWLHGDKLALDVALDETSKDPIGVPSLLFTLIGTLARLAEHTAPHGTTAADNLRQVLLEEHDDKP